MLLRLDDFAPTQHETAVVAGMPGQVAIGYLRAWRHANGGKRSDKQPNIGDLFSPLFNMEDSR